MYKADFNPCFHSKLIIASYYAIEKTKSHFKSKDPKEIVIDEVCGQLIPLITIFVIIGGLDTYTQQGLADYLLKVNSINMELYILISFISFRFFDIVKPFPVSYFDKKYKSYCKKAEKGDTVMSTSPRLFKGRVVKDNSIHKKVCEDIENWFIQKCHAKVIGIIKSPITGPKGNIEFFIYARKKS